MLLTISLWYVYFLSLVTYNKKIGLVVTELCCQKINMNTKEKHIIRSILNSETQVGRQESCCDISRWKISKSHVNVSNTYCAGTFG